MSDPHNHLQLERGSIAKEPPMNCHMVTFPCGRGNVSSEVRYFDRLDVSFVRQTSSCIYSKFSCAYCGILSPDENFCRNCRGPICNGCIDFAKEYECGRENRCIWCDEKLLSSCQELSPEDFATLSSCLADAIDGYPYFRTWKMNNDRSIKFDLPKICWQRYFDAIGWFFFVEAKWFFTVNLQSQYKVVIGDMLTRHSFDFGRIIKNPFFHKFKSEEKEPEFFTNSTNCAIMYAFSIKMLERMEDCYLFTVLNRLRAKHAERLSIELGVYLPPAPPEPDSDDDEF